MVLATPQRHMRRLCHLARRKVSGLAEAFAKIDAQILSLRAKVERWGIPRLTKMIIYPFLFDSHDLKIQFARLKSFLDLWFKTIPADFRACMNLGKSCRFIHNGTLVQHYYVGDCHNLY